MEKYLSTTRDIYGKAAIHPDKGLCCTTTPVWQLPGLSIPKKMLDMNYGCGSTVHPRDLINNPAILYVGVGGGMELLQFAYFSRRDNAIIGVDAVGEMLQACEENMALAEKENPWFNRNMIALRDGDALSLPVESKSIDVAAQNCLFNIFKEVDLRRALSEMYRVLKPHGKLILSDPVSDSSIPDTLRNDDKLRALCLSGAIPLKDYLALISDVGFGTIELRAKRPYRILDPLHYSTDSVIYIESVEICAIKDPLPSDGPCIFTGRTAIYFGGEEYFDDKNGHVLMNNQPLSVCDKTAGFLEKLNRPDIFISPSTWFYDGGGCC
jgi:SAM-dependent methyltransferase